MKVFAIDPGDMQSGVVICEQIPEFCILDHGVWENREVLQALQSSDSDHLAVEMIQSYGMTAGQSIFQTCVWAGRFIESFTSGYEDCYTLITRPTIKKHITGRANTKDTDVRSAIIKRFGGKSLAVGTKKQQGPLYGLKGDAWSALAVALTYYETIYVKS